METNSNFTDTILIVLANDASDNSLIVCSNEATMRNAEAISTSVDASDSSKFHPSEFRNSSNHDYLPSQNSSSPLRKLLYHKEWLDYIHNFTYVSDNGNYKYANDSKQAAPVPRDMLKLPRNRDLDLWTEGFGQFAWGHKSAPDATQFELAIGSSFLSVISRIMPSDTQYTSLLDVQLSINRTAPNADYIDYSFRKVQYPTDLMIENKSLCI